MFLLAKNVYMQVLLPLLVVGTGRTAMAKAPALAVALHPVAVPSAIAVVLSLVVGCPIAIA